MKNKYEWIELIQDEDKEDFKRIVYALCRYYRLHAKENKNSDSHNFREEVIRADINELSIYLKMFGTYEFFVVVEIKKESVKHTDSWIHIDGISQERNLMKEKGNLAHPVFKIKCLMDLFKNPLNRQVAKMPESHEVAKVS